MPDDRKNRTMLHLDMPNGLDLPEALRAVAASIEEDEDESGYVDVASGDSVGWRISTPCDGAPVDPRQRQAAASLLMALDLPLDATEWAKSMMEACNVNPGMMLTGMPDRIGGLREARRLIDEMLSEVGA